MVLLIRSIDIQPGIVVRCGIRRRRSMRCEVHPWTRGPWYRGSGGIAALEIGITGVDLENSGYGMADLAPWSVLRSMNHRWSSWVIIRHQPVLGSKMYSSCCHHRWE